MTRSYIDEQYFVHFFNALVKSERFSVEEDQRRTMLEYFKSKTDIYIDENFEAILQNFDNSLKSVLTPLLNQLTTGRNGTSVYPSQKNKFRDLKNINLYSKLNYPFASFWLGNKYKYSIEQYCENNPYYFLTKENDMDKWKSLSATKTFYVGPNTKSDNNEVLKSWDQLKQFSHQTNDLIINDRYCLKDATGIEANIIPLIVNLSNKIQNILIFVEMFKPGDGFNLTETYDGLKTLLLNNNISANLIIYQSHKTHHSRVVLTNNFLLKSDDSFDYFNLDGTYKTKGSSLKIEPIFKVNRAELGDLIKTCTDIIKKTEPANFIGEKSKNMLDLIETA